MLNRTTNETITNLIPNISDLFEDGIGKKKYLEITHKAVVFNHYRCDALNLISLHNKDCRHIFK